MQQLDLFDYRKDYIFDRENQIAHYYDILSETGDTISYSEHIDPKKGFSVCGMDYEEYVDVKKIYLRNLTYDQILLYLKQSEKEKRIQKYIEPLKFRNIPYEHDTFTWSNDDF
jgi:hypothetical protein